ncbi:hypothetical protein MRS44_016074 [Fusarium solani]|uniref:uncharacterized protein n=1 Tax=Fusarium solani TaxID=169388 RepID=UPI0032C49749|nr:hypothetical protein MRS44_016074 [Fusarium solani]
MPQQRRNSSGFNIPTSKELERLPSIYDVPLSQRYDLVMQKIDQCNIIFDFSDASSHVESKEIKRLVLHELLDSITSNTRFMRPYMYSKVFDMLARNLFRPLRPPMSNTPSGVFDLELDAPVFEVAWPHIHIIYELFLCFIRSDDFKTDVAKDFVQQGFVLQLLELLNSEDPRERDYVKNILHSIYVKFSTLRSFIRRSINHIFLQFTYETQRFNGIAELLEIMGSIIAGFSIPLKEEHKTLLNCVLLPLHKPTILGRYHPQLSFCIVGFLEKDAALAESVILRLLRFWPKVSSTKEILLLNEVEDIFKVLDSAEFFKVQGPLFRQLAKSMTSPHYQVVERTLCLWNGAHFCELVTDGAEVILPIMFGPLFENYECYWNRAIRSRVCDILDAFKEVRPKLYNDCAVFYDRQRNGAVMHEAIRKRKWAILTEKANQRSESLRRTGS